MIVRYILAGLIAYLLGSISTGTLVAKALHKPDLRTVGSKSTGATNALRTMGVKGGAIVFVGDVLKAILACLIGTWITGTLYGRLLAALLVVIGHNWPCFFGFKGGKGVASTLGAMVTTFPLPACICFVCGAITIALTRYVSVGSMVVISLFAVLVSAFWAGGDWIVILWTIVLAVLCIWRHHANIGRLLKGQENKLGAKKAQ